MYRFELVKIKVLSHSEIYDSVVDDNDIYYAFKEMNEDEVISYGITTITDEKVLELLLELLNSQYHNVLKDIIWIKSCYIKVEEYDLQSIRLKQMIGSTVRHFKGKDYLVIGIGKNTETEEDMVIYKALYGDNIVYARPKDMFLSKVDKEKYPEVKQKYRFELKE